MPKKKDKYNEALALYGKAIDHRARFPDAYRQQGIIFLEAGDAEHAEEKVAMAMKQYLEAHVAKAVAVDFLKDMQTRSQKAGPKFRNLNKMVQETLTQVNK